MSRLIYSLLDMTRIASGRLRLQFSSIDLAALVREVMDRMSE